MLEDIKTLLGEAAANFTDAQMELCWRMTTSEIEAYCGRELDTELEMLALRLTIIKLNRLHTEGLASQGFSGVSESYVDGYPADILATLNCKRRIKTL